jgi:D-xylose transport system substrate-binding protein
MQLHAPMRRVLTLAALALALAPACETQDGPQVAFLLSTLQEERYQKDVRFFEARANELGLRVTTMSADNDDAKQLAQVVDVLARGAKVLVIQPTDSHVAGSYVKLAHEKGARVVAYDRAIFDGNLDYYVSHDSYRVGVLQAEAALRATGGKGTYLILSGQTGHSVAGEITRGYKDTLAPYIARGEVEVVLEQDHSAWSPEQAMLTVEDVLIRTSKLDAVLANNSGMARGAVQAIGAAGLTNVFIAGADADAANLNFVCQGKQTIEVLKDIQPLAKTAAEIAKQLLDGARPNPGSSIELAGVNVPVTSVRVAVVTADTVKSLIVDTGVLTADKLPACKNRLAAAK